MENRKAQDRLQLRLYNEECIFKLLIHLMHEHSLFSLWVVGSSDRVLDSGFRGWDLNPTALRLCA